MSRKGENIFHRKDGRWEARYIKGYRSNGTYQYGFLYGKTYQEVKQKRVEVLLGLECKVKKKTVATPIYFSEMIDRWLERQKLSIKISTYSYYSQVVLKHIKPELGNYYVQDITEDIITEFVDKKMNHSTLKLSTVKAIVVILRQILSFCHISVLIKLPKNPKNKVVVLSRNEKKILENYLLNHLNETSIGILLSLYAGLRIGEVCALKWENIDLLSGTIFVQHTVARVQNERSSNCDKKTKLILMEAKTQNSIREIPISNSFIQILQSFKQNRKNEHYVLSSSCLFVDPRSFYNHYKKILRICNLPDYKYHTLRHTFATNCIELGLDPKSLSELLGHSDIKITLSLYVHPSLDVKREFMNAKFSC